MEQTQLHQELRARLLATGKSQSEIGKATGLAQSTVGRFLSGKNDISLSNYVRLCAFCDEGNTREPLSTIEQGEKAAI